MFGIIRNAKRSRFRKRPLPSEWIPHLDKHVDFYDTLAEADRQLFHEQLKVFVWEKHWEGANGMEVTDEVKVVVAAAAVRLTLRLGLDHYNDLKTIIVYPDHYKHPDKDHAVIYGEANNWGTVVLSWRAVLSGLRNDEDGHDTATHEFAHVLDIADGGFDGTPELHAHDHFRPWATVLSKTYLKLKDGERNERKVLRDYGATNEAEFFAVATESFFEKPRQMERRTPELYDELKRFYGLDPAKDR